MRCDIIAEGIIAAAKELNLSVPIVCRLQVSSFLQIGTVKCSRHFRAEFFCDFELFINILYRLGFQIWLVKTDIHTTRVMGTRTTRE